MTRTSNRAQRFSVMCAVAAVVSLGWSPLQALADDGAIDAVGSTVDGATDQVADTVAATANPVDAVSDAASSTIEAVAITAADPIEAVSDAASSTVGNVANAASSTVGNVSNTVGDTTAAVGGAAGNVASGALKSAGQANETVATTDSTTLPLFSAQQPGAADRRSSDATRRSIHDDLVLLAERGHAAATLDNQGPGSCVSTVSVSCVTQTAGDAPGSWEGSVASILKKLLALTGSGLLTWVAASCILTVMGALALHETKRRSQGSPLRSA